MNVNVLLADYATDADRKLTIVGGGWNFTGPQPGPTSLAILVEVPWNETNRKHEVVIELQDEDGHPALIGPASEPIRIESMLEVGALPVTLWATRSMCRLR